MKNVSKFVGRFYQKRLSWIILLFNNDCWISRVVGLVTKTHKVVTFSPKVSYNFYEGFPSPFK